MTDSPAQMHARMVHQLIERGAVHTPQVEEAFRIVPRHPFLADVSAERVYSGEAVVTRFGSDGLPISSSSEPAIMAIMIEQLQLEPGQRVLEIGAGTGYNAAILAHLVGPAGRVTTVDIDDDIALEARANLDRAGALTVRVVTSDGWMGVPEDAPFDRIEATVSIVDLSPHWIGQLRDSGLLVAPFALRAGLQASIAFQKRGSGMHSVSVEPAGFMRLRGAHAGPATSVRVEGWMAGMEDITEDRVAALRRLLQMTPRTEATPALPRGGFVRIALEDRNAVWLQHCEDWHRQMTGIFLADRSSLAVVEWKTRAGKAGPTLVFGADDALVHLRKYLAGVEPLDIRRLQVEAVPTTGMSLPADGWILRRDAYTFTVRQSAG
ncbi:MAG: methyltransferase domain-containing protein [Armatimonadota bacterium]